MMTTSAMTTIPDDSAKCVIAARDCIERAAECEAIAKYATM